MRALELQTPRLTVRTPIKGDGARYAKYYRVNRQFLQPFSPTFDETMFSSAEWESSIPVMQQQLAAGSAARFLLINEGEMIGVANLTQITRHPGYSATLGYTLSEPAQGQGYMREALEAILQWAFEVRNLHRIVAHYMPRNVRSGRLLHHLGFQVEGYGRDYLLIDGVWEDHVMTARRNPNWVR